MEVHYKQMCWVQVYKKFNELQEILIINKLRKENFDENVNGKSIQRIKLT